MKSGLQIIRMNNNPTGFSLILFRHQDGDMEQRTGLTGQVQSHLFPGISIYSMETVNYWEDCYENIKRYVDYVDRNSPQYLSDWGRGDWVPVKTLSSKELTSSVYYYVDTNILAHAAKLFGKQDDYENTLL